MTGEAFVEYEHAVGIEDPLAHSVIVDVVLFEQFGEPRALILPQRVVAVDVLCQIARIQIGLKVENAG